MQFAKSAPFAAATLLALMLSACGTTQTAATKPAEPAKAAEPATPALSPEAKAALAAAEADWKKAKAEFALWTTTDKAYKDAQDAAKAGDSAAVMKLAKRVTDTVKIALEQKNYPSTEMK
jgi:hypothetical protein